MNLAYMAELAVVVNLGYLELKSLRYIQGARASVNEILKKLSDANKASNGGVVVGNEHFMALYSQAKTIFDDDSDERNNAWYVVDEAGKKEWFRKSAVYIYSIFLNDRDKKVISGFLFLSVLSIFIMTLLSRLASDVSFEVYEACIWWTLFIVLTIGVVIPTLFVILGRYLSKVVGKISKNIESRKDTLAGEIIDGKIDATTAAAVAAKSN